MNNTSTYTSCSITEEILFPFAITYYLLAFLYFIGPIIFYLKLYYYLLLYYLI